MPIGGGGYYNIMKISKKPRLMSVDIIKSIAIIMVIITHYEYIDDTQKNMLLWPIIIDVAIPIFMIISGFNYSTSIKFHNIEGYINWFSIKNIKNKFLRILVPYIVALLIQLIYRAHINHEKNFIDTIQWLLTGGSGPGNYYTPIVLQLIVLFPFLYFAFVNNKRKTIMVILFVNILYEALVAILGISQSIYRLSILRYITFILFGIILYEYKDKLRNNFIPILCIFSGAIYLIFINYFGYKTHLITSWENTSLFAAPLAFGFVYYLMHLFDKIKNKNFITNFFTKTGQATYHIFLVQMVYYDTHYQNIINEGMSIPLGLLVNVFICIGAGILFWFLESKIRLLFIRVKTNC